MSAYSLALAAVVCLLTTSPAYAQSAVNTPTTANPFRIYMAGNSMMDQGSYAGIDNLATSRGHDHAWGRQTIIGSPISWIWEHPNDGFLEQPYLGYQNALGNHEWDALALNPTDRFLYDTNGGDVPMSLNFLNLARSTSPNVQLYLLQRTPRRAETSPGVFAPINYPAQWLRTYSTRDITTTFTRDYYTQLVTEIRAQQPSDSKPVQIIPVGDVVFELDFRIKHNQIPGMADVNQIYTDASHYTAIGRYLQGLTFFATMYDELPLGLPVPSQYGTTISPDLAWALQNVVADVVFQRAPGVEVPEPSGGMMSLALAGAAAALRRRRAA